MWHMRWGLFGRVRPSGATGAEKGHDDMEIDYLREFIELSRIGSFTRAASRLGVSRSTLSKHIAALEREFGVEVLERDNLHTRLTPAGHIVFNEAQSLLAAWEAAHAAVGPYRGARPMKLVVGNFVGYKPTDEMVSTVTSDMYASGVPYDIEVVDVVKSCFDMLRAHEIDFASPTFAEGMDLTGLATADLVVEPVVAVVSSKHPLAERDSISPEDVTGNIVWTIRDGAIRHYSECIEQLLDRKGAKPRYIPIPYSDWRGYLQGIAAMNSGIHIIFCEQCQVRDPHDVHQLQDSAVRRPRHARHRARRLARR